MDPMNKKALRERMAALNSEEVKLACETLVWMDPERYIKELGKYVMMQKMDLEHIEFAINHRQSIKDKVTGKIAEEVPAWMPKYEGEWDSGTLKIKKIKEDSVIFADKVDEEEEEGLQPVDPKKIEVPDFL